MIEPAETFRLDIELMLMPLIGLCISRKGLLNVRLGLFRKVVHVGEDVTTYILQSQWVWNGVILRPEVERQLQSKEAEAEAKLVVKFNQAAEALMDLSLTPMMEQFMYKIEKEYDGKTRSGNYMPGKDVHDKGKTGEGRKGGYEAKNQKSDKSNTSTDEM